MRTIEQSYFAPNVMPLLTPTQWWRSAQPLTAPYLDIIAEPPQNWKTSQLGTLIAEIEKVRANLEALECPKTAHNARFYLMAALTDLQTGLTRMASGDKSAGLAYIRAAQVECEFLEAEISELKL